MLTLAHNLSHDVRYGVRTLSRARGFTVVAVTLLALGIGATAAIFSAVDGVLLRPLPYRDPDQLVAVTESNAGQRVEHTGLSAAAFVELKTLSGTLAAIAAYRPWGYALGGMAEPERVLGARVSANLFSTLGVEPLRGRAFLLEEAQLGGEHVVLLGEAIWRRRYGGDPTVVGRTVRLDGQPYTVVGIMPSEHALPDAALWVPLAFAPYELDQRGSRTLSVVARLRPGIGLDAARADMRRVSHALARQHPESDAGWSLAVGSLHEELVGDTRTSLVILFAATAAVLVIACANLGILVLARSRARRREIAVRAVLGADRWRVVRQLATESLLVAAAAVPFAVGIAAVGAYALGTFGSTFLPRGLDVRIDARVLGFVLLVAVAGGLALAAVAARDAGRLDLSESIKSGVARRRRHTSSVELPDVLIAAQIALALLLLVAAGLLVRSFVRAQSVDLGFAPHGVLTTTLSLPNERYDRAERRALFVEELLGRVRAHPGVRGAGIASHLPLAPGQLTADFVVEGRVPRSPSEAPRAQLASVSPGFLPAIGVRVVHGRALGASDRADARPVVLVDQTLAERIFPGESAVGRRMRVGATMGADTAWREIVGVVSRVRSTSIVREPEPMIYVPYAQNPWPTVAVVIRTDGDPMAYASAMRADVFALDPELPAYNLRRLEDDVARALASRRLQTVVLGAFALAALLLSALGVYGTMAYAVSQRTRELGIRIAVGAQRRDVLAVVVRRALGRISAGVLAGAVVALMGSKLLASVLFEVSPFDPATFAGAALLLSTAGVVASYLPAWRATQVDPMISLRRE